MNEQWLFPCVPVHQDRTIMSVVETPLALPYTVPDTLNINFLLTEHEGRTGEYCPEVVAIRTERNAQSVQKRPRANIPQYGSS